MSTIPFDLPWFVDISRMLFAAILGALIGWERERSGREAGIRTYMATAIGACAFGLISGAIGDQGRISAGIVTGIGFLGAGIILRDAGRVTGLTTAATLWASAAVGLATAYGIYHVAAITALLILGVLELHRLPGWEYFSHRARNNQADTDNQSYVSASPIVSEEPRVILDEISVRDSNIRSED